MAHLANVYNVSVSTFGRPDEVRTFGDFADGKGSLARWLARELPKISCQNRDASPDATLVGVSTERPSTNDKRVKHEVEALFSHGELGVVGALRRPGRSTIQRTVDDAQDVDLGVLFLVPGGRRSGQVAVHVPHGRGAKTMLEREINRRLRDDLGLRMHWKPQLNTSLLERAVKEDRLEKVTLVAERRARDGWAPSAREWLDDAADYDIRLEINPRRARLARKKVQNWFAAPAEALPDLLTFEGLTFDAADLQVRLPDDRLRTVRLQGEEAAGAAVSVVLDVRHTKRALDHASLFSELHAAIAAVTAGT